MGQDRPVDMVGGYRLVRKLGVGSRAEIHLGHAGSGIETSDASPPEITTAAMNTVAIKVYRATVSRQSIDSEIAALARTSSPHLLTLRDIATTADGRPSLILPRLAPASLARVLLDRGRVEPGEAVTILAPLATAVAELHRAGVVHGHIHPGAVLFDEVGAPVLAGFGRAVLLEAMVEGWHSPTPAQLSDEPLVVDDLRRLTALVSIVLAHSAGIESLAAGRALLAWLDSVEPGPIADRFAAELGERVFDIAEALPIEFGHRPVSPPLPARAPLSIADAPAGATGGLQGGRPVAKPRGPRFFPEALLSRLDSRHPLRGVLDRFTNAVAQIRRPFWIVGAVGIAAVVLAIVVLPSSGDTTGGTGGSTGTTGQESGGRAAQTPLPSPGRDTAAAESGAWDATGQRDTGQRDAALETALGGEDPVAATEALLTEREHCFETLSVVCLDGVDQPDSTALDDDRFLIRSLQEGGSRGGRTPLDGMKASLAQRLGDSALLNLDQTGEATPSGTPTSLLVVKSEAGWRIRDLLPEQN